MAKIHRVNNISEALALAENFKSAGKYDLFRGQSSNWPVVSSAARLQKEKHDEAAELIKRFHGFLSSSAQLLKYSTDADWFYAVAQHYGLPTNYVDLTDNPKVAAYFSTNSPSNKPGKECVIICLNRADFERFISITSVVYKGQALPSIIKINVDNLWRLQAQSGCFLYTPYPELEKQYDFDRIMFPFTEPYAGLTSELIYPTRKSELEILLDQFFNSENRRTRAANFHLFRETIKMPIVSWPSIDETENVKSTETHESWKSEEFYRWNYAHTEPWVKLEKIIQIDLIINQELDLNVQIETLYQNLVALFTQYDIQRNSNLLFCISGRAPFSERLGQKISINCLRIWDGTRNLPFELIEIAMIISKYIYLEFFDEVDGPMPHLGDGKYTALELTNEYGSQTRCFSNEAKLVKSFRSDVKEIFKDNVNVNIGMLMLVNKAKILFDFHKLLNLFKDEIISYQVWYNSDTDHPVIFYTPTQIEVLGLP